MSKLLIQHYLNELQTLRRVSGTSRESVVREAFKTLLKDWGKSRDLIFIPEYEFQTLQKNRVYPDGALLHELRVPLGYWEAKDEEDDLDKEIEKKFRKGYPQDNIIFEDSHEAVLIQNKQEVMRCGVEDPGAGKAAGSLFRYERPRNRRFSQGSRAVQGRSAGGSRGAARHDRGPRGSNDRVPQGGAAFPQARTGHDQSERHRRRRARDADPAHSDRRNFLPGLRQRGLPPPEQRREGTLCAGGHVLHWQGEARDAGRAAVLLCRDQERRRARTSHHEKQKFLKTIYENFYKVYDKKTADRLGVVYTPNEIVRFMIESADWLCQKHFGKSLIDKNVEILDPAAGTGTFITELIEHFRGQPRSFATSIWKNCTPTRWRSCPITSPI